jgi:ABC-type polysaccharide/polyol phosphate export permease
MAVARTPPLYDSAAASSPAVQELLDLLRYRDLVRMMVVNVAKSRYSRSVLGVFWSLMNPLLHMAVMTVAFSNLFRSELPNYAVYVMCGFVCWNFFSSTTIHATNSLIWGGALLKRIYVPRTVFAFAAVGHGLLNFLVALVPLAIILLVFDHPWTPALWVVPLAVLLLAIFVLGMSLLVSTLALLFTDVVELYQVLLQMMFFLAPIVYPFDILPEWVQRIMPLNPMFHLIEMFRQPVYAGQVPDPGTILAAVVSSAAALLVGWTAFARRADELAYRL